MSRATRAARGGRSRELVDADAAANARGEEAEKAVAFLRRAESRGEREETVRASPLAVCAVATRSTRRSCAWRRNGGRRHLRGGARMLEVRSRARARERRIRLDEEYSAPRSRRDATNDVREPCTSVVGAGAGRPRRRAPRKPFRGAAGRSRARARRWVAGALRGGSSRPFRRCGRRAQGHTRLAPPGRRGKGRLACGLARRGALAAATRRRRGRAARRGGSRGAACRRRRGGRAVRRGGVGLLARERRRDRRARQGGARRGGVARSRAGAGREGFGAEARRARALAPSASSRRRRRSLLFGSCGRRAVAAAAAGRAKAAVKQFSPRAERAPSRTRPSPARSGAATARGDCTRSSRDATTACESFDASPRGAIAPSPRRRATRCDAAARAAHGASHDRVACYRGHLRRHEARRPPGSSRRRGGNPRRDQRSRRRRAAAVDVIAAHERGRDGRARALRGGERGAAAGAADTRLRMERRAARTS